MPDSLVIAPTLLGLIVAAYWYRVLRMAAKARRRTGRAAHLVPPEPIGRALRLLWAPAVLLWVLHPFLIAATIAARYRPPWIARPLWQSPALAWAGVAVAAACLAGTVACWRRMGAAWRMGIDPDEKTPLIATGPFAYVRHPIYALSAVMMLASVAVVSSPLMLAAAAVHVALLAWESHREEQHMLRVHGTAYAHYRSHVGRFFPASCRPYAASG